ncbi:MAG: hypothetical protein NTZ49_00990 [Candidatus Parcubacteria bacterium]|nr:hypothetical protein [Candidatus Parcubacteria bacterium]
MMRKFSIILAKLLLISMLVIFGSILILPQATKAEESGLPVYINLIMKTFDPNDQPVEKVTFQVYEQITDANSNQALGVKWGSGYVDQTGVDIIKIRNPFKEYSNDCKKYAVKYYKRSNPAEIFILWDQCLYGSNESATSNLTFSSAKVVLRDKSNNLLKEQSFDVYTAVKDANNNLVPAAKVYSGQKTSVLGYKMLYLIPGDYFIKTNAKDYAFKIFADTQTDVNLIIDQPVEHVHSGPVYANLTLVSKDPNGVIVPSVSYIVYQQQLDTNNKPILGKRLTSGKIGDLGYKTIKLKNTAGTTLSLAIVYYQLNNEAGKFYLYNQTITGGETKEIALPFSGVKISISDPASNILKKYSFNVYAVLKNSSNVEVGSKKILSNQSTGDFGYKTYYLIPGQYFVTVKYVDPSDAETINSRFSINLNSLTAYTYRLGSVTVTISDSERDSLAGISLNISKLNNDEYVSLGSFKTNEDGFKRVILPAGEYKLSATKYAENFEFIVASGSEKSLSFSQGTFHFKVIDALNNVQPGLKVSIYKYQTNQIKSKVYSGTTNANGEVIAPLQIGNYVAKIDTAINGQKYQSKVFYVQESYDSTYQYVISLARIYFQDNLQNNLPNQKFYLYNYGTDPDGNLLTGKEIGTYTTNSSGYADVNLINGRYIVKSIDGNKIFALAVEAEKFNTYYLTVKTDTALVKKAPTTTGNTTKIITTPKTNTVYMAVYTADNLYNKDTDGDTLSDFEETYIWRTDPKKGDTDGDGYKDGLEIRSGYNPNGTGHKYYVNWAYEKPRVYDLQIEQQEAAYLKAQLTKRIGKLSLSESNWNTLIKAFVYGGYSVSEIQHDIVYGPGKVHPTIPAWKWRYQ